MATIKTSDMRVQDATNLIRDIQERPHYFFVGKPTQWTDSTNVLISDSNPPNPENTVDYFNSVIPQLLSLKLISPTDVKHLINRNTWTTGTVYDMYRHDYSVRNSSASGSTNLAGATFYVVNSQNSVYVCLYNVTSPASPGGIPSTVEPLSRDQEAFYTADGYQWKYMYTLSNTDLTEHSTNNFVPISDYVFVPRNGEINTVVIDTTGTGYTSSPSGVGSELPHFFCRVTGDGSGAVARVEVALGGIQTVEIVRPGQGYTYANLYFRSGFVYRSLEDLDAQVNGLNALGNSDFRSTVIITPNGGWGSDIPRQLLSTKVGIFTNLNFDISDFINNIQFRQLGILNNIEYADNFSASDETLSAHYAIKFDSGPGYELLEEIVQPVQDENGSPVIARGTVVGWDSINGILRFIQDPRVHRHTDGRMYKFSSSGGAITGLSTTTARSMSEDDFTIGGRVFVNGYSEPEYRPFTGRMIYVTNKPPITRDILQTERVSLVISY
jgi:hypothetical protein